MFSKSKSLFLSCILALSSNVFARTLYFNWKKIFTDNNEPSAIMQLNKVNKICSNLSTLFNGQHISQHYYNEKYKVISEVQEDIRKKIIAQIEIVGKRHSGDIVIGSFAGPLDYIVLNPSIDITEEVIRLVNNELDECWCQKFFI